MFDTKIDNKWFQPYTIYLSATAAVPHLDSRCLLIRIFSVMLFKEVTRTCWPTWGGLRNRRGSGCARWCLSDILAVPDRNCVIHRCVTSAGVANERQRECARSAASHWSATYYVSDHATARTRQPLARSSAQFFSQIRMCNTSRASQASAPGLLCCEYTAPLFN